MTMSDIPKWFAIVMALFAAGGSWAVGEYRDDQQDDNIEDVEERIDDLEDNEELRIRMEERQIQIDKNVNKIMKKLEIM